MIMWTLYIAAWGLCGIIRTIDYPSEQQCYTALNELYKRHKADDFKVVTCSHKQIRKVGE
jgi:hypothetical protein